MQEVFEKVIEKLKEKSYEIHLDGAVVASTKKVVELDDAISIVKEMAGQVNGGQITCDNIDIGAGHKESAWRSLALRNFMRGSEV